MRSEDLFLAVCCHMAHSLPVSVLQRLFVFDLLEANNGVLPRFYATDLLLSERGVGCDQPVVEICIFSVGPRGVEGFGTHGTNNPMSFQSINDLLWEKFAPIPRRNRLVIFWERRVYTKNLFSF